MLLFILSSLFVNHNSFPRRAPLVSGQEFELIGLLLGVAIYNSIIVDLPMPGLVYKKLKSPVRASTVDDLEASFLHRYCEWIL